MNRKVEKKKSRTRSAIEIDTLECFMFRFFFVFCCCYCSACTGWLAWGWSITNKNWTKRKRKKNERGKPMRCTIALNVILLTKRTLRLLCNFKNAFMQLFSVAVRRRRVLFAHIGRKGVDTAFWSCSKKSFRNLLMQLRIMHILSF